MNGNADETPVSHLSTKCLLLTTSMRVRKSVVAGFLGKQAHSASKQTVYSLSKSCMRNCAREIFVPAGFMSSTSWREESRVTSRACTSPSASYNAAFATTHSYPHLRPHSFMIMERTSKARALLLPRGVLRAICGGIIKSTERKAISCSSTFRHTSRAYRTRR